MRHGARIMTALEVFQHGDTFVVSSETVAEGSGVEHRAVLQLIQNNMTDFEDFGRVAFETRTFSTAGGIQSRRVALLNEQQATLLMTYQRNTDQVRAFKRALVKAFFEMARRVAPALPQTYAEALRELADKAEQNAALEAKVQADAPKVLFADSVSTSHTAILVRELATILRGNGVPTGEKRLYEQLRDEGYLIKREGTDYNMPTQKSMELGLFRIKETAITHSDGHVSVSKTPKVTGKGQTYFISRYTKELANV